MMVTLFSDPQLLVEVRRLASAAERQAALLEMWEAHQSQSASWLGSLIREQTVTSERVAEALEKIAAWQLRPIYIVACLTHIDNTLNDINEKLNGVSSPKG